MDGYELTVDTTALEKANKTIEKMVNNVELLQQNMSNVFAGIDVGKLGMALGRVQDYFTKLSQTNITPNIDTKKIENIYDAMDKIVAVMSEVDDITAKNFEFYDTRKIHATAEGLWDVEKRIADLNEQLDKTKTKWQETFDIKVDKSKFQPPTRNDGKAYGERSKTYKDAYAAWENEERVRLTMESFAERERLEIKRAALKEILKQAKEQAALLRMTAAEQADYVIAQAKRETKAVQEEIKTRQSEYSKTLSEMRSLDKSMLSVERKNTDGKYDDQLLDMGIRYEELYKRRQQLESEYGTHLVEIAKQHNAQALSITVQRLEAEQKAEEQRLNAAYSTPQGALDYADSAKTINEMKRAQKYLLEARGNADANDTQTIKNLNDAYTKLRMTIESLTTAEKNENALQPTLRNEYARLLVELDKLTKAEERLKNTNAFKNNDASAQQELVALMQRRADVTKKMEEIEKAAQPNLQRKKELEAQLTAELQKQAQLKQGLSQRDISRAEAGKGTQQAKDYVASVELANRLQAEIEAEDKKESAIADVKRKHRAQQAMEEIAEIEKMEAEKRRLATISADEANRLIKEVSNDKNVANIKQEEVAIEKLTDARNSLDKNSQDYDSTLKSLNDEIEKHTHQLKLATDASYRKKEADKTNSTYEGAKAYREQARSIQELIKSIEYMKTARKNLDIVNDKEKIEELNKSIRRTQREVNRLEEDFKNFNSKAGNLFGQLARRMAALYSVSAIEGYVKKVAEVRGEFEMQQKSLQLLVGNIEEANKIWDKTIAMAVKSPFKVRELVTYTKQLSAYRIETEKLYDTTKMLADVSAGLGVDMNRLILAYGQVKTAEYLRGTELRQFSEAGVNMLEELAKQFSAVEGKAISVGEVFDRISKRMVTFEHVNKVFETITGEGGAFYQMQEKQSETLKGTIMNFQDSIDLMLNDIGRDNERTLKNALQYAKLLLDNWRMIAPLMTLCSSVALVYAGNLVKAKIASISLAATWRAITSMHPLGWVTIIAGVVMAMREWILASKELQRELQQIDAMLLMELSEKQHAYRMLADSVNDLTQSEMERNKAYEKLKMNFADILPDQYLEMQYIQNTANGYKEAREAMQAYYNDKAIEQKKAKLETTIGEGIQTDLNDLIKGVNSYVERVASAAVVSEDKVKEFQHVFGAIATKVVQDVKDGTVQTEEMVQTLIDRLVKYFEDDNQILFFIGRIFNKTGVTAEEFIKHNINQLTDGLQQYATELDRVEGLPGDTQSATHATKALQLEREAIEEVENGYKNLVLLYKTYREEQEDDQNGNVRTPYTTADEIRQDIEDTISALSEQYPEYKAIIDTFNQKLQDTYSNAWDFGVALQEIPVALYKAFQTNFGLTDEQLRQFEPRVQEAIRSLQKNTQEQYLTKSLTSTAKESHKATLTMIKEVYKEYGVNLNTVADMLPELNKPTQEIAKMYRAKADALKAEYDALKLAYDTSTEWYKEIFAKENNMDQVLQTSLAMDKIATTLGDEGKKNKGGAQKDWFSEIGKSIRDTHKDFLTLHQDLNKADALYWAIEKHKDVFKEAAKNAGLKDLDLESFTNYENAGDAIEGLEALLDLIPEKNKKARLSIQKMIGELTGEDNVRQAEEAMKRISDAIDKTFDTYEISIELDKMGVSPEIANQLFGIESIDLSDLRQKIIDEFGLLNVDVSMDTDSIVKYAEKAALAKEQVDALRDALQKTDEMESKELLERQQKYLNFLVDQQGKRVKILVQEMRDIEDIQKTFTLSDKKGEELGLSKEQVRAFNAILASNDELADIKITQLGLDAEITRQLLEQYHLLKGQKDLALSGVEHTTQEALDKQTWEDFKKSGYYEDMFEDLTNVSSKALGVLETRLKDMRSQLSHLPPEAYKEVQSAIDKIEAIQLERNPFRELIDSIKELRALNRNGVEITDFSAGDGKGFDYIVHGRKAIEDELGLQRQYQEQLQNEITIGTSLVTLDEEQLQLALDTLEAEGKGTMYQGLSLKQISDIVEQKKKEKKQTDENVENLQKAQRVYATLSDATAGVLAKTASYAEAISNALGGLDQLLESLGLAEDSTARAFVQGGQAVADMIVQVISLALNMEQAGVAANSMLGIIGYIAIALQTVAKLFSIFSALHDAKLQVEIDKQAAAVEKLEKAYERLQKQMDSVYNIADIQYITAERQKNSEEQIASYERMIELEEQKKDSDAEKIKEWREAIEEEKEAMLEAERERKEAVGGFGNQEDYKEASTAFVEAWLDAYKETGNGLKGLNEQFDEFFADMVKKQLLGKGVEAIMAPFYEEWNKVLGDGTLSDEDAANIKGLKEQYMKKLDDFLTVSAQELDLDTSKVGELGTLQKGIQGITEDQADILASYLNSIRFFVAEQTDYLKAMASSYMNVDTPNPMVNELKIVADNTTALRSLFEGLLSPHNQGGMGLKVIC